MGIKKFLEKFIALPIGVFRNRMDKIEKRIQTLDAKLTKEKLAREQLIEEQKEQHQADREAQQRQRQKEHQEIQEEQRKENQQQREENKKQRQEQEKQLTAIESKINGIDKRRDYKVGYEAGVINSFYEAYEEPDFEEKFLRLVDGLERSEIAKIVCILERQRMIKGKEGRSVDLYTPEEQEAIKHMAAYRESHTLRINENLFCYDGYLLQRRHFEASVFYFKHGVDDMDASSHQFIKGKSIIDVGGFYGDSVLVLEELEPKDIYTFEAIEANYNILQETMKLNGIDNCVAEKLALGDEEGEVTFDICGSQSNMQTLNYLNNVDGTETAQITTLDKYMESRDMEIGLIKVDIEGAEQSFLRGAKETITKHKPVLLMSIYHNADDFFGIKPMIESWDLGYKFKIHKPCDFTVSREVLLICEP